MQRQSQELILQEMESLPKNSVVLVLGGSGKEGAVVEVTGPPDPTLPPYMRLERFSAVAAIFGPRLPPSGITANLVIAQPLDGCAPLENRAESTNAVVLIQRGDCSFVTKVLHAQEAGAEAAVVFNHETSSSEDLIGMRGDETGADTYIPSVFVSRPAGELLLLHAEHQEERRIEALNRQTVLGRNEDGANVFKGSDSICPVEDMTVVKLQGDVDDSSQTFSRDFITHIQLMAPAGSELSKDSLSKIMQVLKDPVRMRNILIGNSIYIGGASLKYSEDMDNRHCVCDVPNTEISVALSLPEFLLPDCP